MRALSVPISPSFTTRAGIACITAACRKPEGWAAGSNLLRRIDRRHFEKPANNILLQGQAPFSHNFCPFIDRNPKGGARYKALSGIASSGLKAWISDDGVQWRALRESPVMAPTKLPMFDSQNLAFWSESEGCYVAYVRQFRERVRSIVRATSADFVNWSPFVPLDLGGAPADHISGLPTFTWASRRGSIQADRC